MPGFQYEVSLEANKPLQACPERVKAAMFGKSARKKLVAGIFLALVLTAGSLYSQVRKYRVITPEVRLHLDPDERSPVVVRAPQGAILTQASAVRFRHNWIFVYYYHPEKGKTLAGYVWEPELRKLFPMVNARLIHSGQEVTEPRELDFSREIDFPYLWGIPKEKLLEVEGQPLGIDQSGQAELLQYHREIMNRNCLVEYVFIQNQLIAARFLILDVFFDNNYYISDFIKAKNYLVQRFGLPVDERTIWFDSTYQERQEYWGQALGAGLVEFRSSWLVGETEVEMVLTGSENRVALMAECIGQKYKTFFSH